MYLPPIERFFEQYSRLIGLLMLTFVLIMLFSTPSMILAKSITSIGTELSHATGDELMVRTKLDFGSNEHMQAFTPLIGNWTWTGKEYASVELQEALGADAFLLRRYYEPGMMIELLLMQSNNRTSFHPPIVCYPALGYTIENEGRELVTFQNASWAADRWIERRDSFSSSPTIAVKKLVVTKQSETGATMERQVVLYFYVKERPLASDAISMVRVSAFVPVTGPYEEIVDLEKDFMTEMFPYLFEVRGAEPRVITTLAGGSILDQVAILLLVLAPVAVIFYPELKAARRRRTPTERYDVQAGKNRRVRSGKG
jgi:hypothetical protein